MGYWWQTPGWRKTSKNKPSCFEVERGTLTKATNMQQVKQDVVSEWSILNHLKRRPVLPYQNMANRTLVPRFSSPRHRILYPKFGYGILGIHRIFRICRLVCLWRLAVSKHGHPFQPLKTLKITRTGLGVSTPIPKFSSLILVGRWWQTPGWRKTSKNKPSCFEVERGTLTKATNMQQAKQDVVSEWSLLNHLKKTSLPYQNMANRTFVPRFSAPRYRILSPKFGFGLLGGLICLLRLGVSKHWNRKVSTWASVSTLKDLKDNENWSGCGCLNPNP